MTSQAASPLQQANRRDLFKFSLLVIQYVALLVVFDLYDLESPLFSTLSSLCFAGAAIHYWVPFKLKQKFFVALSLGSAFILLPPVTAALLVISGLAAYAILRSPVSYRLRVAGIVLLGGAVLASRLVGESEVVPADFVPVFGALFMFRMIIYLYDMRHSESPPGLVDYLTYFYLLPNYYFLLFPVVDFETLRRSHYSGDYHVIAQTGIRWIVRGTIHLLLYRLVYQVRPAPDPAEITSLAGLLFYMLCTFLLYLRVSGHFHIIAGMLHLFGFNLPETNRRYLLARNLTDFWRRINVYWKDFMVKIIYFPVFFRLRRRGELLATIAASSAVFVATWALHSYQWYWLRGEVLLSVTDILFWGILGGLFLINVLYQARTKTRSKHGRFRIGEAFGIVGTLLIVIVLWSLWSSPTVGDWWDLVVFWS